MGYPGNPECGDNDYFCVEASNNPDASTVSVTRYFPDFDSTAALAETLCARFSCVWMSEWGKYRTNAAGSRETWMYFWWTEHTGWGDHFDRGTGYPEDRSTPTEYRRLVDDREDDSEDDSEDD